MSNVTIYVWGLFFNTIRDTICFARSEGIPTLRFAFWAVLDVIWDIINLSWPTTTSTLRFVCWGPVLMVSGKNNFQWPATISTLRFASGVFWSGFVTQIANRNVESSFLKNLNILFSEKKIQRYDLLLRCFGRRNCKS